MSVLISSELKTFVADGKFSIFVIDFYGTDFGCAHMWRQLIMYTWNSNASAWHSNTVCLLFMALILPKNVYISDKLMNIHRNSQFTRVSIPFYIDVFILKLKTKLISKLYISQLQQSHLMRSNSDLETSINPFLITNNWLPKCCSNLYNYKKSWSIDFIWRNTSHGMVCSCRHSIRVQKKGAIKAVLIQMLSTCGSDATYTAHDDIWTMHNFPCFFLFLFRLATV